MFIPLLPFLMIAASLQESVFNYFNYNNAADLAGWTSRFFASSTVSQALLGAVTFVELRVEPLFPSLVNNVWTSLQLENVPLSSFFVTAPGSSDSAGYGSCLSLLDGGLAPTRPSSAVAPIRGFANRPSTSATSHHPRTTQYASLASSSPIPTLTSLPVAAPSSGTEFLSHPSANTHSELEATGLPTVITMQVPPVGPSAGEVVWALSSSFPRLESDAYTLATPDLTVATSTPTPIVSSAVHPTPPAATGALADRPSLASRYAWILPWMLPVAIHLSIGIGIYLAHPKEAGLPDILRILRLHEELRDLPRIIDRHNISPGELRSCIELAVRTRRSVNGNPMPEPEVMSAQNSVAPPSVSRALSAGSSPVPGPSNARTANTPNPPGGLAATTDDLATAVARFVRLSAEMQARQARADQAMKEVIDSAPRRSEDSLERDAPVASTSAERWKTEMRERTNVSPLAPKILKRSSGLLVRGVLPTPESLRMRTRAREPPAGSDGAQFDYSGVRIRLQVTPAANDLEEAGFNPAGTSSQVRSRQPDRSFGDQPGPTDEPSTTGRYSVLQRLPRPLPGQTVSAAQTEPDM
ncbi:hypothetical protein FRC06_008504, partial [Ceratobasidium sp. 370]